MQKISYCKLAFYKMWIMSPLHVMYVKLQYIYIIIMTLFSCIDSLLQGKFWGWSWCDGGRDRGGTGNHQVHLPMEFIIFDHQELDCSLTIHPPLAMKPQKLAQLTSMLKFTYIILIHLPGLHIILPQLLRPPLWYMYHTPSVCIETC